MAKVSSSRSNIAAIAKLAFVVASLSFSSGCSQQGPGPLGATQDSPVDHLSFSFNNRPATAREDYGNLTGKPAPEAQIFAGITPVASSATATATATDETRVHVAAAGNQLVSGGTGSYELNFENAEVGAVSKAILGDILKVNYLVDKRVAGQITLTSSQPVPRSRLVPLLESSLASIGAAIIKDQDLYRVVPSADPGGIGSVDYRGTGEGFGTSVIAAKFVPAANLGHLLEGFGSRAGSVRVDPSTNLVIVQGTASERQAAIEAANTVDVDWLQSKSVAILPVANSSPETIIGEINHILDTGEGGMSQNSVQLEPMTRLNAVLAVSRRSSGIDFARKWVSRLDRSDPSAAGVKVYRLQYAQAKTVAAALNDLFGSGASSSGQSDRNSLEPSGVAPSQSTSSVSMTTAQSNGGAGGGGGAGGLGNAGGASGGGQTPFGALKAAFVADAARKGAGDDASPGAGGDMQSGSGAHSSLPKVRVTADPTSNSLFINASAPDYRLVERAIRQMDRMPVQVNIEATIAEVTLTQDLQYGVQFFVRNKSAALGLSGASGVPLQTPSAAGLNLLVGPAANPKLLLDALQSVTSVKILSSPSLVVLDRQPAVLQVGDQVPILTRTAQSVDTSTTAPIVNTVDYRDTGIILNVLPRVNANGIVSLDVEQEISAVTSTDDVTLTPTISQRRVRSSVAVANGQTVMLAGLISDKQSASRSGIPGLSSIRFLNDILTSHDNAVNRTEIIIFIRPRIITTPVDAQQVTEEFHDRLLSMRREVQPAVIRKY